MGTREGHPYELLKNFQKILTSCKGGLSATSMCPLKVIVASRLLDQAFFYFFIGVGGRNRKRDRKAKLNGLCPNFEGRAILLGSIAWNKAK